MGDLTVSGTGTAMGYGNINVALSLARQQAGTTATSKDFLGSLDTVMDMRASGMGWGQIAKDLGFNLGQAISGAKHNASASNKTNSNRSGGTGVAEADKDNGRGHDQQQWQWRQETAPLCPSVPYGSIKLNCPTDTMK